MEESIFSMIINGDLPSHKIYEDDKTIAILDINPVTTGHCLVISKTTEVFLWDLDSEAYQAVMTTVRKVAKRIKKVMAAEYVGMRLYGLDVPHVHVHVFPFNNAEEYARTQDPDHKPDHEALAEIAKKLAF